MGDRFRNDSAAADNVLQPREGADRGKTFLGRTRDCFGNNVNDDVGKEVAWVRRVGVIPDVLSLSSLGPRDYCFPRVMA